jgi:hypothetical protein
MAGGGWKSVDTAKGSRTDTDTTRAKGGNQKQLDVWALSKLLYLLKVSK